MGTAEISPEICPTRHDSSVLTGILMSSFFVRVMLLFVRLSLKISPDESNVPPLLSPPSTTLLSSVFPCRTNVIG